MLELKNINKDYITKYLVVNAIKDFSIKFRKSEFVSILGPSGCGKTTLLNIIGGLDQYTSGDLIINDKSTKQYKSRDWDSYRNHTIGFVFQSYNLIMHLNVWENIELSLKLSGISKEKREEKVKLVLEKVGLADKANALPNELSGGQMQRVAIARALVNDPDILLADEPTGALDSETSVQVLELLKEISLDRLVIMVTHNPDLAYKYSTRIVKMLDGRLIEDSNPFEDEEEIVENSSNKTSMSFLTALKLSFKNMLTKKARTILIALAGSIGIIGIALILSMSHGFQKYIDDVQESSLAEYPLTIEKESVDYSFLTDLIRDIGEGKKDNVDHIEVRNILVSFSKGMQESSIRNDMRALKKFIDENEELQKLASTIRYKYNSSFYVFPGGDNPDPNVVYPLPAALSQMRRYITWEELIDSKSVIDNKYELLSGTLPQNSNDVVVVLNAKGEISDIALYMLGERTMNDLLSAFNGVSNDDDFPKEYDLNYFIGKKLRYISDSDLFELVEVDVENEETHEVTKEKRVKQVIDLTKLTQTTEDYQKIYEVIMSKARFLNICGVVKSKSTTTISASAFIGGATYSSGLRKDIVDYNVASDVVKAQFESKDVSLFDGKPFSENGLVSADVAYQMALEALGYADKDNPDKILIYASTFENKDKIISILEDYNKGKSENDKIKYTDDLSILMSSISEIINAVSYVLIAFVSVSLIVSSIMIGVITYISVLERTKEIGVLRSIGASKKDISRVFNAETLIIGFISGLMGVLISLVLLIPINIIIKSLTQIPNMGRLPFIGAIALIIISTLLTLIAGIIPSRIAAKKDPVKALRTD